jgi:hypothetical protein
LKPFTIETLTYLVAGWPDAFVKKSPKM